MAKFMSAGVAKYGNDPNVEYYTNAPRRNERIICGVNCNCPKKRKTASDKAIPGYDYLKFLGKGGFGKVHLYRDRKTCETVAIKSLPYVVNGQDMFHEVASEYDIVTHIDHPNITHYYTFFTNPALNMFYIVMEYASRGPLRKLIDDQLQKNVLFRKEIVLKIVRDILCGVQFLNKQHVVHCDLKPDNILVGDDDRMKICDFGTAHLDYDVNATLAGTPVYMAPEQFDHVRPNEKTEIWAIGIILYELCALRHPVGYSMSTTVFKSMIRKGRFPPFNSYYGSDMKELVDSMLHVDPKYRHSLSRLLRNKLF